MKTDRACLVGHDSDGWIITVILAIVIVMIVVAIIVYGGAFIGGFHSIKNYILAFKHNVYDSNKKAVAA